MTIIVYVGSNTEPMTIDEYEEKYKHTLNPDWSDVQYLSDGVPLKETGLPIQVITCGNCEKAYYSWRDKIMLCPNCGEYPIISYWPWDKDGNRIDKDGNFVMSKEDWVASHPNPTLPSDIHPDLR